MGIGRQEPDTYTFGDKRELFSRRYATNNENRPRGVTAACIRPERDTQASDRGMQVADQRPWNARRRGFFVNKVSGVADRDPKVSASVKAVTDQGVARFAGPCSGE